MILSADYVSWTVGGSLPPGPPAPHCSPPGTGHVGKVGKPIHFLVLPNFGKSAVVVWNLQTCFAVFRQLHSQPSAPCILNIALPTRDGCDKF